MIERLKLYDVKVPKIRLGNKYDGGYILPVNMLTQSEALFAYGVGTDISFELDYSYITNKPAYLYDHTINSINIPDFFKNLILFKKEGLSPIKNETQDTFINHYYENNFNKKVLLKIDIEEAEFNFFLNTDIKKIAELTTGLIIEFHPIYKKQNLIDFFEILGLLNEYYLHCHLHGNNYASCLTYEENNTEFMLPHVMEMTFINKSLVKEYTYDNGVYPNPCYDIPNDLGKPEINLDFLKFINNL